ncbi:ABC transporter substrate-binding protein [Helcococcus kunzii]|uniref:taurine ABC transporter substrate-binding protein n=1 Tax=Helcococcus kunzii TaxID=40091 RepID=UPI001C94335F|nr:MetQ/NlpA family ABC transporter substrate-binding protein [Helcococcus kunzii]QZO75833.1 ABC transporter substrate-binding protein [Helcococcus kunzii]
MNLRNNRFIFFTLLLILFLFVGCSKKDDSKPEKIKIGTIRVPDDKTVAYELGFFKEYFENKGIKVELIFFDSGTAANVAFASGDLDFAEMGYTNGVVALNRGLDVELIWIHEVLGSNEALVVQDGKNINSIKDLRGKTIATPFSSTSHYSLMKALELEGLTARDIKLLDMNTEDIVASWSRGDLDAVYTWEPTLGEIKKSGKVLIDSAALAEKGITTVNIELVNKQFSKKYPNLVADYIKALDKGITEFKERPENAIKAASKYLGVKEDLVKRQMESTIWLNAREQLDKKYLGTNKNPGDFNKTFLETAKFLQNEKKIDKIPTMEQIDEFINSKYIEKSLDKNGENNE